MTDAPAPFRVALTIDAEHPDRPTRPGIQGKILDALDRHGVRATFFVQGRWVEAYPDVARSLPDAGHLVGSHSFYHARMPLLSERGFATDVRTAQRVIEDVVGVDPRPWFRFPFGAGFDQPALNAQLDRLGYRNIHWHVDGLDWRIRATAPATERSLLTQAIDHGDGAMILLHSWPRVTARAIDTLIPRLRDAGATFVRVDDLGAA